jgi:hypothetical protein
MKFKISRTSDCSQDIYKEIELNSLEDVINLVSVEGSIIFLSETEIEIYDEWRE